MFSINAKICTLKYNDVQEKNIFLVENKKYIIPIYQRPYEWSEEHIQRFISDLFTSFWGANGLALPEPLFFGTMQLSKEKNKKQDVIDGQQRLSTILLLLFVLKKLFPDEKELEKINLSWLSTRVHSGKQQEYLEKIFNKEFKFSKKGKNQYQINATLIKEYLEEKIRDRKFERNKFIKHILGNVYFSVIETEAKLSKTLQIFDSINTGGLKLNGNDVFKIRMYVYLRDIKKQDETTFEKIDKLFRLIDDNNEKFEQEIYMNDILQIYQHIIIAKYKLPRVLYTYGTDTFFEQLFDTILKTNVWEHFKNNVKKIDLSLETLKRIIDIRYEWANPNYETAEDGCAEGLINHSRYGKYSILIFIFLFIFKGQPSYFHDLMLFMRKLCKLYTIYSIRYDKAIREIHTFTYELIEKILKGNYDKVIDSIIKKIGTMEDHKYRCDIEEILNGDIVYNPKRKNIVCRLSAMLHEKYLSKSKKEIEKINGKIFNDDVSIDIEHIQSYNDKDENEREEILNDWGDDINSIGNLMVLESSKNRSIKNISYSEKKKRYGDSVFQVVQDQIIEYEKWDIKKCRKRKAQEVQTILSYLFS